MGIHLPTLLRLPNAMHDGGRVTRIEPAGYDLVGGFHQLLALLAEHGTFSRGEGNQFILTERNYGQDRCTFVTSPQPVSVQLPLIVSPGAD